MAFTGVEQNEGSEDAEVMPMETNDSVTVGRVAALFRSNEIMTNS